MELVEFLLARIAEDEATAKATPPWLETCDCDGRSRVLAECEAKRRIVELHKQWPVLVEGEPEMEQGTSADPDALVFRMAQRLAWVTEHEYVKRFGVEPPTTPMLRALAAVYADHPDYRKEWAL